MLHCSDGYPGSPRQRRGFREPGSGLFDLVCTVAAYAFDRFENRNVEAELAHCRERIIMMESRLLDMTNSNFNLQQVVLDQKAKINDLELRLSEYEEEPASEGSEQNPIPAQMPGQDA